MSNDQVSKTAVKNKHTKTTLAKAGELSLSATYSPNRLFQEVGNDQEFLPLTNVTTAYMDQEGNIVDAPSRLKQVKPENTQRLDRNRVSQPRARLQIDYEYAKIASKLKNTTKSIYDSMAQKQHKQKVVLARSEQELAEIEHIIGQIQEVMNASLDSALQSPFKVDTKLVRHTQKRNWQTKGLERFGKNNSISRLEEMLLSYNFHDENLQEKKEIVAELPAKAEKNRQRKDRNRKYRELQKQLSQPQEPKKPSQIKPAEQAFKPRVKDQWQLGLQDIEIVQFQWAKLPIIVSPLYVDNFELFIRMREFPQNQSFIEAIKQVFAGEKKYKTYSIFNGGLTAGLKDDSLLSQQQYRQQWASEWQYEVEQQQTKDLLCEFDFQWYRALVQISYSHSLEQLLMKKIKYDSDIYKQNVRRVNGTFNDKNKVTDDLEIGLRVLYNRLKYVQIILNKFYEEHIKRSQRHKAVIVGVVPSLGEEFAEPEVSFVKEEVQKMFVGGLYAVQNTVSMAVVIPLSQTRQNKVQRVTSNLVKLGNVNLLINHDEKSEKAPKIVLKREKLKNSLIKIEILREKEQAVLLEVGEELHFGRRYHIDID